MKSLLIASLCLFFLDSAYAASAKVSMDMKITETYYKIDESKWQLERGVVIGKLSSQARSGFRTAGTKVEMSKEYEKTDLYQLEVNKDEVKVTAPVEGSENSNVTIYPAKVRMKNDRVTFKTVKMENEALAMVKASLNGSSASSKIKVKKATRSCVQESESTLNCNLEFKVVFKFRT